MEPKANLTTSQLTAKIEDLAAELVNRSESLLGSITGSPTACCDSRERPYGLNDRLNDIAMMLRRASDTMSATGEAFFEPTPPLPEPAYRMANEAGYTMAGHQTR